ncbi:hypothetical protein TEA_018230 [Camellia sinensis var. sinensis]|uniref:Dihydroflavonol 4-reductase n=1 Tax=Camellia sinensis var. sinensis TaxID=542762 RepID=A0A4S4D3P0_CAMSN|nr:hypothetical protein TEA_018230 [Camellia sinensis var. sinensis]
MESCSSVDSEEFEPEALVDSGVAHRQDNSKVKTGLEEAHRGWFNSGVDSLELINPALKGTLNVLGSCAKSPTVKRVVLTSSTAAVECIGRPRTPNEITDETWFSDPEFCKENKVQDAAWKFAKEKCIDMVVINPSIVIGPLLQPTLNASSAAILELINGSQTYPNVSYGWINVKDVANAHIQAYEIPSASGRYCLVERIAHYSEVVKILHELYPSFQLPRKVADDKPYIPFHQVSQEKAKTLGIDFISLEEGLKEIVESLTEKKFFGM